MQLFIEFNHTTPVIEIPLDLIDPDSCQPKPQYAKIEVGTDGRAIFTADSGCDYLAMHINIPSSKIEEYKKAFVSVIANAVPSFDDFRELQKSLPQNRNFKLVSDVLDDGRTVFAADDLFMHIRFGDLHGLCCCNVSGVRVLASKE